MNSWATFDIFDTVLTRQLSRPVDAFTLLGERLREEGIRVPPFRLFRLLRIRCERWSRRFDPDYEVKLPDIHRMLGRFLFWSEKDQLRGAELEREIESSVLKGTPHGIKAVQAARGDGRQIAYVSDMYLEEDFIKKILKREGLFEDGDLLAISGEWKASKARGTVWKPLIEALGVAPAEIFHQGDNPHSDVESPKRAGIPSQRLGTAEVSRWEQPPEGKTADDLIRHGGIAALSRLARAHCKDPDDYWTCLGAGVLGPMLAGFTEWIFDKARMDGVGTLWFLSRDGWLMHESARAMAKQNSPEIKYLCAGRRQLQLANGKSANTSELLINSRCKSLRLAGSRLALSADSLEELAADLGLSASQMDQPLSASKEKQLIDLLESAEWKSRLEKCRLESSSQTRSYLADAVKLVKGRLGVVDVGWQGRSQDMLEELYPELAPLRGYYLGYSEYSTKGETKSGWIYDCSKKSGSMTLSRYQRVFEALIGGVSGPLRGYREACGVWEALFDAEEKGESAPGRDRAQAAALEFVRLAACREYAEWWTVEDLQRFTSSNLDKLFLNPTQEDARQFESWTVSTDEAHLDSVALAGGYDLKRIQECLKNRQPWAFLWPRAAIMNSTLFGKIAMQIAWKIGALRG